MKYTREEFRDTLPPPPLLFDQMQGDSQIQGDSQGRAPSGPARCDKKKYCRDCVSVFRSGAYPDGQKGAQVGPELRSRVPRDAVRWAKAR